MPSALEACTFAATRSAREQAAHALAGQQPRQTDTHDVAFRDHSVASGGGSAPACRVVGLQSRPNQMEPTLGMATLHLLTVSGKMWCCTCFGL